MNVSINKLIPEQTKGKATDAKDRLILSNTKEASELFVTANNRMLNVNRWHEYSGLASARFFITDTSGNECNRAVQEGDYIKIDIPGPGPRSGDGYDWVHVDALESNINSSAKDECCGMMVRAAENPAGKSETAHFFTSDATSTFIVERTSCTVSSYYFGRNEELNLDTKSLVDKIRNAVIGSIGLAGVSELQWKRLINSFLQKDK
jgi:hypothetical protein